MFKKIGFAFTLVLFFGFLLRIAIPVSASPAPQVLYPTPTAGSDGRILYTVQQGDTCLSIYLKTQITVDQLRTLNNLDTNCTVIQGQKLLLGVVAATTPTVGVTSTPTSVLPKATAYNGNGNVCVYLFNDINGNTLVDSGENAIAGGAVSLTSKSGDVSKTGKTDASGTPLCFNNLPEGDYNISMAPPEGYNSTTTMNYPLKLKAGDSDTVDFGAQNSTVAAGTSGSNTSGRSPLLAILGMALVLGGAGLGIYFRQLKR
ncbi:MAG: SdrD B-like domain-containing protein [Anaerolineaceae bacterium]|nr:SdrD B-like domain-containing protein [Anaerolineaceae bacterium]